MKEYIVRNKKKLVVSSIVGFLIVLTCLSTIFIIKYNNSRVKDKVILEVGSKLPDEKVFLLKDNVNEKVKFISDINKVEMNKPSDYTIEIKVGMFEHKSKLLIKDTTPPVIKLKDIEVYKNTEVKVEEFIDSIYDVSDYEVYFKEKPDFTIAGLRQVNIEAKDTWGNIATAVAKLIILEDKNPPIIEGTKDQTIYLGDTISYKKGVSAKDDVDGEVELIIDSSKVNLDTIGVYEVTYTAKDKAGNISTVTQKISVNKKPSVVVDINTVNALADEVLGKITNNKMTKVEKARAIHNWVKGNIRYTDHSDKSSWIKGAYEGFNLRKGDCFVYFATSKALLTRAGIDNIDVKEINNKHYWNMINCGEGWYHYDATVFKQKVDIFMWTDTKIDSLYLGGRKFHTWDKSTTPPTPEN